MSKYFDLQLPSTSCRMANVAKKSKARACSEMKAEAVVAAAAS
jgi:hypothetical protein